MTTKYRGAHSERPRQMTEGSQNATCDEAHHVGSGMMLVGIFAVSIIALGVVFYTFPHLEK